MYEERNSPSLFTLQRLSLNLDVPWNLQRCEYPLDINFSTYLDSNKCRKWFVLHRAGSVIMEIPISCFEHQVSNGKIIFLWWKMRWHRPKLGLWSISFTIFWWLVDWCFWKINVTSSFKLKTKFITSTKTFGRRLWGIVVCYAYI